MILKTQYCGHCGMHMLIARLGRHRRTAKCERATEMRLRWRDVVIA